MKKKDIKNKNALSVSIINFLTKTEGTIICNSSIRLDGVHKGEIQATDKIVIGENAVVEGDIIADKIEIYGLVKGNSLAKHSLALYSTANYSGIIKTNQIVVYAGAVFSGEIYMSGVVNAKSIIKNNNNDYHSIKSDKVYVSQLI